jgi:hypothetical protein
MNDYLRSRRIDHVEPFQASEKTKGVYPEAISNNKIQLALLF